jgi:hypothetical protein
VAQRLLPPHLAWRGHVALLQPVLRDDLCSLLVQCSQVDGAQLTAAAGRQAGNREGRGQGKQRSGQAVAHRTHDPEAAGTLQCPQECRSMQQQQLCAHL